MNTAEALNAYQIARMAGIASPDTPDSPGAEWLELIHRDAVDLIADYLADDDGHELGDLTDEIHERADQIVPIYTHHRWTVFVDLAAYQEDVTDYGPIEDMTDAAGVALYMIAQRIYDAVIEDAANDPDNYA